MLYNDDKISIQRQEFREKMQWFEDEFEHLFRNKTHLATAEDKNIADSLLDKLSEVINQYKDKEDKKILLILNDTFDRIEKKYPELFLELKRFDYRKTL